MSQGKVFSDSSIKALNAILRRLPELGPAEINYLVERLTAMKGISDVGQQQQRTGVGGVADTRVHHFEAHASD